MHTFLPNFEYPEFIVFFFNLYYIIKKIRGSAWGNRGKHNIYSIHCYFTHCIIIRRFTDKSRKGGESIV